MNDYKKAGARLQEKRREQGKGERKQGKRKREQKVTHPFCLLPFPRLRAFCVFDRRGIPSRGEK